MTEQMKNLIGGMFLFMSGMIGDVMIIGKAISSEEWLPYYGPILFVGGIFIGVGLVIVIVNAMKIIINKENE